MILKIYNDAEMFYNENIDYLLKQEAKNLLMINNAILARTKDINGWILARVESDENEVQMIIILASSYHLLIYLPTNNKSDELFKFVIHEFEKLKISIPGINTDSEYANKFALHYIGKTNKDMRIIFKKRILVLDKLKKVSIREDVIFKKAEDEDIYELIDIFTQYYEDTFKKTLDKSIIQMKIEKAIERGLYVIINNNKIVSIACLSKKTINGYGIGIVCTLRKERNKGFAKCIMYNLTKMLLDEKTKLIALYTDDKNNISNHLYESLGYKRISDEIDIGFI